MFVVAADNPWKHLIGNSRPHDGSCSSTSDPLDVNKKIPEDVDEEDPVEKEIFNEESTIPCPKCGSDKVDRREEYRGEYTCLNCGHYWTVTPEED